MRGRSIVATLVALLFSTVVTYAKADVETDSMALSRVEHRLNRGLVVLDNPVVPKGQWIVGTTASYSTHVNDNYSLALIDGIYSDGYTVKTSPVVAYAFRENMAAGVRFEYGRSLLRIDSALLSVGSGDDAVEISLQDYYSLQHSFSFMAIFRQYIPLGGAKRFALFAETRLEGGGSQSKYAFDQPVSGTFARSYSVGLGVVPGIVAFATDNVAFEISVAMMGVGYSHTEQVHNQVYLGEFDSSNVNFKINLLSVGLGVAFYL